MAKKWKVLLAKLHIRDYVHYNNMIMMNCPIHDGDNQSAFNINVNANSDYFGKWFCNSKKCHEDYNSDLIGFTRAILEKNNPNITFAEIIKFCEDLTLDIDNDDIVVCDDAVVNFFSRQKKVSERQVLRDEVRSRLIIPSQYYIDRGFSPEILNEFDVGLCDRPNAFMYNRAVFPVYDETGTGMIGCTGRTVNNSPDKWINSKGFNKAAHLYGYNRAVKRAKETSSIILVEGQGDVLRMHEAGVINTVGIFGSSLSDQQEFILQKSGILNVILALDNDDSGRDATEKIRSRLSNFFNIYELNFDSNDIGETSVKEVQSIVKNIRKFI